MVPKRCFRGCIRTSNSNCASLVMYNKQLHQEAQGLLAGLTTERTDSKPKWIFQAFRSAASVAHTCLCPARQSATWHCLQQ